MPHAWEKRWKLEERLGKGGQGVTHIASSVDDSSVRGALKYLKNNLSEQARGRMLREVVNLQTLEAAGGAVPKVLDHNTADFKDTSVKLYVVMELIPGLTLTDYISKCGPLGIEEAIEFTNSLCRTIKIAHTFPILHRDIKPDNIIVRDAEKSDLVLVDYGLSFNASDESLTETGETFRNRFLDLPETNTPNGDRRDLRSDLTALCAILYYCLTGNVPGQLLDGTGTLPHMRKGDSLHEKCKDDRVPYLEEFFTRGFAPNIANRYQTVNEITTKLNDFVQSDRDFDKYDPIQLAASFSSQLRAIDRTTQLAEFHKYAKKLLTYVKNEADKYTQKLDRFRLINTGHPLSNISDLNPFGEFNLNPTHVAIPDGLDFIAILPWTVVLQIAHHPNQKHRRYAVASSGEQCVLLSADYTMNTPLKPTLFNQSVQPLNYDWQEIVWFDGDPESIYDLVSVSYKDWLTSKMKELMTEIDSK